MFACAKVAYGKTYTSLKENLHDPSVNVIETTDYWVPLLEKAFAKFCGSYMNLNGGITANGLHYLTGGATIKIDISPDVIRRIEESLDQNPEDDFDGFFDFLREVQKTSLLTTSNLTNDNGEKYSPMGIIAGHAYTIVDCRTVKDKSNKNIDLVQIMNPQAGGSGIEGQATEWQGDWSDNSSKWNTLPKQTALALRGANQQAIEGDDGTFWMSKQDWLAEYEIMTMCFLPDFFK